jgi:hypothetical protein
MSTASIAEPRSSQPVHRTAVVVRCVCCGTARSYHLPRSFCLDCLERAKPHDASDPYDELGEGD